MTEPPIPTLTPGHAAVPPRHIATVVTNLEMHRRPPRRPGRPLPPDLTLRPLVRADPETYRHLFRAVGADWLWSSRLAIPDAALAAILASPQVEVLVLRRGEQAVGMVELDFRQGGACELAFLGLTRDWIGTGLGRALMNEAIHRAWSRPIERFWLHTCTLDHPGALAFYRRSGFEPFAVQVEIAPDPRLDGLLPRDCAAHVPRLG